LYGIYSASIDVGIDCKATSIEAFVDVENGRMTIIDNGEGITPETLKNMSSSGVTPYYMLIPRVCRLSREIVVH